MGLLCGVGIVLAWRSGSRRPPKRNRKRLSLQQHMAEILAQAGIESVTPTQLLASSVGLAVAVFFLLRSMTKHLRKVQKIDFNEPPGSAPKEPTPRIPPGA